MPLNITYIILTAAVLWASGRRHQIHLVEDWRWLWNDVQRARKGKARCRRYFQSNRGGGSRCTSRERPEWPTREDRGICKNIENRSYTSYSRITAHRRLFLREGNALYMTLIDLDPPLMPLNNLRGLPKWPYTQDLSHCWICKSQSGYRLSLERSLASRAPLWQTHMEPPIAQSASVNSVLV